MANAKRAPRQIAAKLADVARRYGRRSQAGRIDLHNLRLPELRKLFRLPHRLGLDHSKAELDAHIIDLVGDPGRWTAHELGVRVGLTFDERTGLGIRTIQCCDKTAAEMAEFNLACRRARGRKRAQLKRAAKALRKITLIANSDLDVRAESLFSAIGKDWVCVSQLMRDLGHHRVWQGPNGKLLRGQSLRRAMNRELSCLAAAGWIEQRCVSGSKGLPKKQVRRG